MVDDRRTPLLEAAQNDLGVGVVGDEGAALPLQLLAQLARVVDLAVEHECEVAIVAVQRLVAGRDVDDGQPAHADREVRADLHALPVGATMHDRAQHPVHQLAIGSREAGNTAHDYDSLAARSVAPLRPHTTSRAPAALRYWVPRGGPATG